MIATRLTGRVFTDTMTTGARVSQREKQSRARLKCAALAGVLAMALLGGCGGESASQNKAGGSGPASVAQVHVEPGNGARAISPAAPVKVTVDRGRLDNVTLANPGGKQVAGKLSDDGKSWTASEALGYDKTYTWSGQATGSDGKKVPVSGSFSTVHPAQTVRATLNPIDHTEVGVAMPISVKFDSPVKDKKAAQRALQVTTSVPVEGAWAWLSDTQIDWRPKQYWPAGTQVSVNAKLYGVPYGNGAYGKSDVTSNFTIGREQIVKADVNTHQLVVLRDGKQVASYPASYGEEKDPNRNTPNGTYIAMQKDPIEIMDNPRYGYTNVVKKWAVRISNHGEFIHENEDNRANLGKVNNSHGCANLSEADAKAYFDSALIGDPVEVTGSASSMEPHFDVFDWMLPWDQWLKKSTT